MNNLCSKKEQDYFVIESISSDGITMSAEDAGVQGFILFNKDNTVQVMVMGSSITGTWDDATITIDGNVAPFSVEGDVLKFGLSGSLDEDPWFFRRSDEEPPADGEASGGGTTAEIAITDGFVAGRMSVVCPDGWFFFPQSFISGVIKFVDTPDSEKIFNAPAIEVVYRLQEAAQDKDEDDTADTQIKYFGDSAVKVRGNVDKALLEQIMETVQLTWETEQSTLAICEGKDEDFFKIRSSTPKDGGSTANLAALKLAGFDDSAILFRKDGTVRAKFNVLLIPDWKIGNLVSGTWKENVMTFTEGENHQSASGKTAQAFDKDISSLTEQLQSIQSLDDTLETELFKKVGVVSFTLDGDLLTLDFELCKATFRRCNDDIPEILSEL